MTEEERIIRERLEALEQLRRQIEQHIRKLPRKPPLH